MGSKNTQFKAGHSGGPGRPKGSKNKLSEAFLLDLYEHYMEEGKETIKRVCEKDPGLYVRIISQLVPKDLDISHSGDISVQVVDYGDD